MTEWRGVPGWEEEYEVSSDGQVRGRFRINSNGRRVKAHVLKPWPRKGYDAVSLWKSGKKSNQYVHRLVMLAFDPIEEEMTVDHIDADHANNRIENLGWLTRVENGKRGSPPELRPAEDVEF